MNEPHVASISSPLSSTSPRRLVLAFGDVIGGGVAGLLTITYGLSYAALIFSGPLSPWLGYGLTATFISSAAIALVVALGSSFRFAVGGVDGSTAAVAAILASSIAERMAALHPDIPVLLPVLLTMSAATILTGALMCALGMGRVARAIRYVPYPVIGGFLGATGVLLIFGAVKVVTGRNVGWDMLWAPPDERQLFQLAAAAVFALIVRQTRQRFDSALLLPALLIGTLGATQFVFYRFGMSAADAQQAGWTFVAPPSSFVLPWRSEAIAELPVDALPALIGNIVAVVFVTAITALFNTTGIEVEAQAEADLDRELGATGLANVLAGALGGYSGCISISRSMLNLRSGGRGRGSGLIVAAMAAAMLVLDPAVLAYVPKFLLGGLLLGLGASQLKRWTVSSLRRLSAAEYLSLIAIALIILHSGFIAGVLIGVLIGCTTFAVSASRISSIKFSFNATEYRSSLDRAPAEMALLGAHGTEIQGLNLQSYLFFGSANRLYQHVKALLHDHPECRHLVFDFSLVNGLDSSAAYSFDQIKRLARERGARLVLVNLAPRLDGALRSSGFISGDVVLVRDLDRALEWCENELIARHATGRSGEVHNLAGWLAGVLGGDALADELIRRCRRVVVRAGDVIAHAGEPASSMHFIVEGRVNIVVPSEDGQAMRVRSLGRFTTVGEMGMVSGRPRSATIEADADSTLYALPADQFELIKAEHPELAQALLVYFMSVMAERLGFANRTIAALRR